MKEPHFNRSSRDVDSVRQAQPQRGNLMRESTGAQGPYSPPSVTVVGLRIFESVARLASFSRAAEELHVSQPYVSNQIHELEAKLKVSLFRRVGRRVYLTKDGFLLNRNATELL